jgi:hypothetical protein
MAKTRQRQKKAQPDPVAPSVTETPAPPPPDATPASSGSKVPGVLDSQLHVTLHEAHRVLMVGTDAWDKVLDNVERQFVRPLLNAHDGDSEACAEVKRQIEAFRSLYR